MLHVSVEELLIAWQADQPSPLFRWIFLWVRARFEETLTTVHGPAKLAVLHLVGSLLAAGAGCRCVRPIHCLHELSFNLSRELKDRIMSFKGNIYIIYKYEY
jgi:hypothetical protein